MFLSVRSLLPLLCALGPVAVFLVLMAAGVLPGGPGLTRYRRRPGTGDEQGAPSPRLFWVMDYFLVLTEDLLFLAL